MPYGCCVVGSLCCWVLCCWAIGWLCCWVVVLLDYMLGCSGSWPVVFVGLLCCWGSCVCCAVVVFGLLCCWTVESVVFVGSVVFVRTLNSLCLPRLLYLDLFTSVRLLGLFC